VSVAALVVAVQPDGARAAGACEYNTAWGTPDEGLAKQVVDLVNQHRAGLGLSSVAHSATLMQAAEWKAGHMLGNGYMDHDDPAPAPRTADERLVDCGYRSPTWGENIAYGQSTAKAVMDSWLTSEGHRENIERPAFTAIGVGAVRNSGTPVYWTQVFGLGDGEVPPVSLLDLPVPAAAPASPANVAPVAKPSHARASKGKRTIKRRGRVAARRARGVGIQMRNATKLSVKVRVKGRKGTRLMLRCGGQVKARGIVRKRSLVRLNARRVVGTSCRVIIRAPKRTVSYRLIAVAS
jgi:uncharacterized protein YkwD